jgi:4-alpha-glucanotransferase
MKRPGAHIDRWGILSAFNDAFGNRRTVSKETRKALRQAMGNDEVMEPSFSIAGQRTIKQGTAIKLDGPAELRLEDGSTLRVEKRTPKDLPCGYHELRNLSSGRHERLFVTPAACYLPPDLHAWGWAVQLYALRSARSWGIGDLGDLKAFGRWTARTFGCGFCLINPLGAATPVLPQQTSPYYPGSRCFLNPLYLRIEDVPGAQSAGISLDKMAQAGRQLNSQRLIQRDEVFRLKFTALEKIWRRSQPAAAFERFCQKGGAHLRKFALFCCLARRFNGGWQQWPAQFHTANSPLIDQLMAENRDEIRFHQWLQWLLQGQMKSAAAQIPVIHDLPIGVDPAGADAWIWQDFLARGAQIGAPPDAYNAQGQNWGMQPFSPHRLKASFFEPFRLTIRAAMQYGGGLRIDHVMGLDRLFWIPEGKSGREGAYVHYPLEEMLAILAIESHRAKALVIGEDLGTVEPAMRREFRRRNILSYRLLWFENGAVRKFPRQALTAISTHDLFTLAGLWSGADYAEQEKLGLTPSDKERRARLKKLCRRLRISESADMAEVIVKTHGLIAQSPSILLAASLEDALGVNERPNVPGTINRPNWSLALPLPLHTIQRSRRMREICRAITKARSASGGKLSRPPVPNHRDLRR